MRHALMLGLLMLLRTSAPAEAQARLQSRDGFTIAFGVGGGSAGASCAGCTIGRETAPSLFISVGRAVRPALIVSGEVSGWMRGEDGAASLLGFATVDGQWYPVAERGFFLKGGVGLGGASREVTLVGAGSEWQQSTGAAYQVGTGYDVGIGRSFSLSPYLSYLAIVDREVRLDDAAARESPRSNVLQVGLAFTWH